MKAIPGQEYIKNFVNFKLINRQEDIDRISSILCRKQNNSLLITGPEGVGVSSILLGLQQLKQSSEASLDMQVKQFFWLDVDDLFASGDGQKINEEFQLIIHNLMRTPNSVLIIQNAYTFLEGARNSGNSHFINTINNADKSKSFQVIMEVNDNQLSEIYKENNAINEFYTLYEVKELKGKALEEQIIEASKTLITYHNINIDNTAITEAIKLTNKYRDDFGLGTAQPGRALNLLDRALSSYKQAIIKEHPTLKSLRNDILSCTDEVEKESLQSIYNDSFADWMEAKDEINKISQALSDCEALRIKYEDEIESIKKQETENQEVQENNGIKTFASLMSDNGFESKKVQELRNKIKEINKEFVKIKNRYTEITDKFYSNLKLESSDVIEEFCKISRIPTTKLNENELENLKRLENNLLSDVFGQDDIVKKVANAIKVARLDTVKDSGPAASFLFLGPSGVGKTFLSKSMAYNLFGDEKALIRFDMSEYMEKHAVAKLIGAPPGYEGFECGGILTNTVRKNPVGIYLFDEIEKAHPDVFNIFLQILSDGRLTDNIGRTVDFSEAIIIMTSNIGQKYYLDASLTEEEAIKFANEELNNTYRSELLNRFNGRENIFHFKRLSMDIIQKIIKREINKLSLAYSDKNLKINMQDSDINEFCNEHYDVIRGARGLPGYIKANLRPIIVNQLLNEPNSQGIFNITYNKNTKTFDVVFKRV